MVGCYRGGTAWGVRSGERARAGRARAPASVVSRFRASTPTALLQPSAKTIAGFNPASVCCNCRSNLRTRSSSSPRTACERSKRLHLVQQQRLCACLRWGCTCPSPRSNVSAAGRSPRQILPGDVMKVRTRPAALANPTTHSQVLFRAISGLWRFLGWSGTLLVVLISVESVGKCARACAYVRPPRAPPAQASAHTPCCYATEQRCKAERVTRGPGLQP